MTISPLLGISSGRVLMEQVVAVGGMNDLALLERMAEWRQIRPCIRSAGEF